MSQAVKSGYATGLDYPHTKPEFFQSHSVVMMGRGEVRECAANDLTLSADRTSLQLPGTNKILPGHKLTLGDGISYENRFAIIGIGSNCSPNILMKKFQDKSIGGDFVITQSKLSNHAICHGAFMGGKGTVPATVLPHQGTDAHITVGFFTAEQAAALTDTEPNYDLVAINAPLEIKNLSGYNTLPKDTMLYVSIWGALSTYQDAKKPMVLSAIPQDTTLQKFDSRAAMSRVSHLVESISGHSSSEALFNYVAGGMPLKDRLKCNWQIVQTAGIAPTIAGSQIKPSTIGKDCTTLNLATPAIAYE